MRGWLIELIFSTIWLGLFYFGRDRVERYWIALFADVLRMFDVFSP